MIRILKPELGLWATSGCILAGVLNERCSIDKMKFLPNLIITPNKTARRTHYSGFVLIIARDSTTNAAAIVTASEMTTYMYVLIISTQLKLYKIYTCTCA